jgi:hypothetical protein
MHNNNNSPYHFQKFPSTTFRSLRSRSGSAPYLQTSQLFFISMLSFLKR